MEVFFQIRKLSVKTIKVGGHMKEKIYQMERDRSCACRVEHRVIGDEKHGPVVIGVAGGSTERPDIGEKYSLKSRPEVEMGFSSIAR
jgi:hypothetical protein